MQLSAVTLHVISPSVMRIGPATPAPSAPRRATDNSRAMDPDRASFCFSRQRVNALPQEQAYKLVLYG